MGLETAIRDDKQTVIQGFSANFRPAPGDPPFYPWVWQNVSFDPQNPNAGHAGWSFPAGGPWARVSVLHDSGGNDELGAYDAGPYYTGGLVHVETYSPKNQSYEGGSEIAGRVLAALNRKAFTSGALTVWLEDARISSEREDETGYLVTVQARFSATHTT